MERDIWLEKRYHLPSRDEAATYPPPHGEGTQVVIPAHNEAAVIEGTLVALVESGVPLGRIIVVDSMSTDETPRIAAAAGVRVISQVAIIEHYARREAMRAFGLALDPVTERWGKGAAMFAAALDLAASGVSDETGIFFMDADIDNLREANPLRALAHADDRTEHALACIKCAHHDRDNEVMIAYFNTHFRGTRYADVAAFTWPLCGQLMIRMGALRRIALATGYSIETVMLMHLVEQFGLEGMAQVGLPVNIRDRHNDRGKDAKMFAGIMRSARAIVESGVSLGEFVAADYERLNRGLDPVPVLVPRANAWNESRTVRPERLLPPLDMLIEAGAVVLGSPSL